ncbi:MAG: thiamine phosphate synthase [Acidobacteriota bacterium]
MTLPRLCAILDVDAWAVEGRAAIDVADAWLAAGVRFVQLRAKRLPAGAFLDLAVALAPRVADAGGLLVINDRADIAALAGAAGVHVGQDDLAVDDARAVVGADAIVGLSTHSIAQVAAGLDTSATYLAVGPVFGTVTKDTGYAPVGLALVRRAAQAAGSRPLVAIGGITLATAPAVVDAGAAAVAVISDLLSRDVEARARRFVEALG